MKGYLDQKLLVIRMISSGPKSPERTFCFNHDGIISIISASWNLESRKKIIPFLSGLRMCLPADWIAFLSAGSKDTTKYVSCLDRLVREYSAYITDDGGGRESPTTIDTSI